MSTRTTISLIQHVSITGTAIIYLAPDKTKRNLASSKSVPPSEPNRTRPAVPIFSPRARSLGRSGDGAYTGADGAGPCAHAVLPFQGHHHRRNGALHRLVRPLLHRARDEDHRAGVLPAVVRLRRREAWRDAAGRRVGHRQHRPAGCGVREPPVRGARRPRRAGPRVRVVPAAAGVQLRGQRVLHLPDARVRALQPLPLPLPPRGRRRRGLPAVGHHHVGVRQQAHARGVHRRRLLHAGVRDTGQLRGHHGRRRRVRPVHGPPGPARHSRGRRHRLACHTHGRGRPRRTHLLLEDGHAGNSQVYGAGTARCAQGDQRHRPCPDRPRPERHRRRRGRGGNPPDPGVGAAGVSVRPLLACIPPAARPRPVRVRLGLVPARHPLLQQHAVPVPDLPAVVPAGEPPERVPGGVRRGEVPGHHRRRLHHPGILRGRPAHRPRRPPPAADGRVLPHGRFPLRAGRSVRPLLARQRQERLVHRALRAHLLLREPRAQHHHVHPAGRALPGEAPVDMPRDIGRRGEARRARRYRGVPVGLAGAGQGGGAGRVRAWDRDDERAHHSWRHLPDRPRRHLPIHAGDNGAIAGGERGRPGSGPAGCRWRDDDAVARTESDAQEPGVLGELARQHVPYPSTPLLGLMELKT